MSSTASSDSLILLRCCRTALIYLLSYWSRLATFMLPIHWPCSTHQRNARTSLTRLFSNRYVAIASACSCESETIH